MALLLASQVTLGKLFPLNLNVLVCKMRTMVPPSQLVRGSEAMFVKGLCEEMSGSWNFYHWFESPGT